MHLIETDIAQHRLQQIQAQGCRYWAWPCHPLGDLAWVEERKVARVSESSGHGSHPFPPQAKYQTHCGPSRAHREGGSCWGQGSGHPTAAAPAHTLGWASAKEMGPAGSQGKETGSQRTGHGQAMFRGTEGHHRTWPKRSGKGTHAPREHKLLESEDCVL